MEETFNSSFAQPPKKVRTLRTVAALLLIFGLLPYVIHSVVSLFLDMWTAQALLGTLLPIAKIAALTGWILLLLAVSEKYVRYCIIVLAVAALSQLIGAVSVSYQIRNGYPLLSPAILGNAYLIATCLMIYAYSILLQSKRLSKQSLMWITFLCIVSIVDLSMSIGSNFMHNVNWGNDYLVRLLFNYCIIYVLSIIAYWKFCHSELFEGDASGEIDMKTFSPLNKYVLTTLIMIAVSTAILVVCDRFIVDLLNN